MSNFFNYLKKIFPKKQSEKKAKEEEDVSTDLNLNIEIKKSDVYEKLEFIVSGIKIKDHTVENFDTYLKKLSKIISTYNKDQTELNYRYKQICSKDEKMVEDIDKMKVVGKIGIEPTILDTSSASGNFNFDRLKICAKDNFPSIRGSNAVFKGRFSYEVQIVSNRLMQLGWCTLQTPFKPHDGVGDDGTSFAFDGYRLCRWHNGKETYGQYWDSGDIFGVCIDLVDRKIEYFRNGVSFGIAFTNIPVGENIAYFPGISMSVDEEITFNFGKLPFNFTYAGYEPYDLPDAIYTNSLEITSDLLALLKNHILKLIQLNDINFISKIMISNKIFDFLVNVSFKDLYVLKKSIFPFLCDLSLNELELFFNYSLKFIVNNEKIEFIIFLFENLCGFIEEASLRGQDHFNYWKQLINLFSDLLRIEDLCMIWIEGRKCQENLRSIFNSNNIKFSEVLEFLKKNVDPKDNSFFTAMKTFKKDVLTEENQKYETLLSNEMSNLILRFIKDEKIYKIKNRSMSLQSIIFEYFDSAIDKFQNVANQNNIMGLINLRDNTLNRENEKLLKNSVLSLFSLFTTYLNIPLEEISIDQWFSRLNSGSLYYDEIGIGGTISHVTTEYGQYLSKTIIPKNEKIHSVLFHRIIKVFHIVLPMLRLYSKNFEKTKITIGAYEKVLEMGYDIPDKIFKFNLLIFTQRNQSILYTIGYFLVNLMNTYISSNNHLLYFIPMFDIPFEIFKFLLNCKSPLIRNAGERKHLIDAIPLFKEDNFIFQIVYFYTLLFSDSTIANPELKESFLQRVKYFLSKKKCLKVYEESTLLISLLIKGILHYMSIDAYANVSCEIFLKIIQPWVLTVSEKPELKIKNQVIIENIITYFKSDPLAFTKFMDPYNKYLNQIMTEYSLHLREVNKIMISNNIEENNENRQNIIRKFRYSFSSLANLMKIMEFLVLAYPNPFLDVNSINFSYFASFLKNLSNRIVEKNYFAQTKMFFEKFKADNQSDNMYSILLPIVGLFINIGKNLNQEHYAIFISKVANLSDLDLDPFLDIYELLKTDNILKDKDAILLENYKEIIINFEEKIKKKSDRKMSLDEWEKATKNDDICILCYTNPKDRILLPCKHDCCNDCLIQYLHSKKTCFICNAQIEKVEEIKTTDK